MAHFALLDNNNVVVTVLVGRDEDNEIELSARTGQIYKQTSYNTNGGVHCKGGKPLRKNYAGVGYTYDEQRDAFIPPKPYPSWILNEQSCQWEAPVPMPTDVMRIWDESTTTWITNTPSLTSEPPTPIGM